MRSCNKLISLRSFFFPLSLSLFSAAQNDRPNQSTLPYFSQPRNPSLCVLCTTTELAFFSSVQGEYLYLSIFYQRMYWLSYYIYTIKQQVASNSQLSGCLAQLSTYVQADYRQIQKNTSRFIKTGHKVSKAIDVERWRAICLLLLLNSSSCVLFWCRPAYVCSQIKRD